MPTWVLFLVPTLIWASTWHVILYQLGSVPVLNSVGWRFGLAALLLAAVSRWQKQSLKMPLRDHGLLLLGGVIQYGGNYWGVYEAESYIPSGLVAVLFALMVFTNAIGAWLCFGQKSGRAFLVAALGGVVGVAMVFWPEIASTGARTGAAYGLAVGLGAVAAASVGNMLTLTLTRQGLPLLPILAWSMGYGAAFLLVLSVLLGQGLQFDFRLPYVLSWLYLSLFGSVVAFVLFFKLAQRQGPARAALMGIVIPVIALSASALFEGWQPSPLAIGGMLLCLGSVVAAQKLGSR